MPHDSEKDTSARFNGTTYRTIITSKQLPVYLYSDKTLSMSNDSIYEGKTLSVLSGFRTFLQIIMMLFMTNSSFHIHRIHEICNFFEIIAIMTINLACRMDYYLPGPPRGFACPGANNNDK